MPDTDARPRVAVSACLLGRAVRYDGGDKRSDAVLALAAEVELVPLCPEVELGLGVPRPAIELVRVAGQIRLLPVGGGADLSDAMRELAVRRVAELAELGVVGYVLKARSPSCGLRVAVASAGPGEAFAAGRFADVVASRAVGLPVIDEVALAEPGAGARFLARVRAARRA
jgi:uncharacterized protein YbbK (DUF523 family)